MRRSRSMAILSARRSALLERCCLISLIFLMSVLPVAAERPCSLVRNGGFDSPAAWEVVPQTDDRQLVPLVGSDYTGFVQEPARCPPATIADGGNPGGCIRLEGPGVASQEFLAPAGRGVILTAAVDVWLSGVSAQPGKGGYAYATVCQTDAGGRVVAQDELVHLTGTQPWRRYGHSFRLHPAAEFIAIRCGLSQPGGEARFDNWTLVPGEQAKRLEEVRQPALRPEHAGGTAAILHEPTMPVRGAASSVATIAQILGQIGASAADLGRAVGRSELLQHVAVRPARSAHRPDVSRPGSAGTDRLSAPGREPDYPGRLRLQRPAKPC